MTKYLSYNFEDSETLVSTFDELPLWSASFGLLLLKHLELKRNMVVADIGSGAGFPLMELAGRMGSSCKLYGVDTWANANKRARQKIRSYELSNVEILETDAEKIPLGDNSVDLIVSNLGINNFENPHEVFHECQRILKPGGKLALTTNLNGHWKEFYSIFENTIREIGNTDLLLKLRSHQEHRGTVESISRLFTSNGFKINHHFEESFEMNFLDGSAFLNHYFIKLGWLSSWREMIPEEERKEIFSKLEHDLNQYSNQNGSLKLTVPMVYIEGEKTG